MTTRKLFKRRVIELIHWLPYEEAIKKEEQIEKKWCQEFSNICWEKWSDWRYVCECCRRFWWQQRVEYKMRSITIWRVMKAILNHYKYETNVLYSLIDWRLFWWDDNEDICNWKLTNEDWRECTDDDQTDETIEKLYNLIKSEANE